MTAILGLLAEDVVFTMPPLPAWFAGREAVGTFVRERVFATPWHFRLTSASGQPAMVGWQGDPVTGAYGLGALNVLTLTPDGDRVAALTAFLDPAVHARLGLPVSPSATPPSG